ncbi:GNAT family N-acetyltransferase [Halobacteriaceae archaeon SHR40]|uniref:GNAT family N-acetyltransferase n=1 Tax=Halovenus amylolytica TaxID=2500550 RepID=UPI000FE3BD85
MVEFRPVPAGDRRRYREILRYAFSPERGPVTDQPETAWPPTLFDQRGLYDGDELLGTCKLYYFDARLRGEFQKIGGLGAVATAPEHRGQRHSRDLCRSAIEEYHDNGVGFVALWPFSTSFYRNLGWGVAHKRKRFEFPPAALPEYDVSGQMQPLDATDWERLRPVETADSEGFGLSMRRSEQWWHDRTLSAWTGGTDPYIYGYERDGTLEGYLVYSVDNEGTLSVADIAASDEEANRGILNFLGGHGAQIETIVLKRPPEYNLLDRVERPKQIECTLSPGAMVRLTAVSALETLSWPEIDLDCTISVDDPLVERNDGRFSLSVVDGDATVRPQATGEPDLTVEIGTLSQLAVGTHGVETASRLGGLDIRTKSLCEPLASLFERQPVYLQEFF